MNFFSGLFGRKTESGNPEFGLVLDRDFHQKRKWVCALTYYLYEAIIREFSPVIISSQREYDRAKGGLRWLVSAEAGWSAPKIEYGANDRCLKAMFLSDPHGNTRLKRRYLDDNSFDFVFSYYRSPFFRHFTGFSENRFVHMPWSIPDEFLDSRSISVRSDEVVIFGGKSSPAYNVRNWCRGQAGVVGYDNSGVENKVMDDRAYFEWLRRFDAAIAAGSDDPQFDLVTPKYFEIAAAGCLLFGQRCTDLEALGFDGSNSIIFTKDDFVGKLEEYKKNPGAYLEIRRRGRELIRERHTVSRRIELIRDIFGLRTERPTPL